MVAMVCYMHWLVLTAYRSVPPRLSNQLVMGGVLVFIGIAGGLDHRVAAHLSPATA